MYKTYLGIGLQYNLIGWFFQIICSKSIGVYSRPTPTIVGSNKFNLLKTIFVCSITPLVGSNKFVLYKTHFYKGQLYTGDWLVQSGNLTNSIYNTEGLHPVWIVLIHFCIQYNNTGWFKSFLISSNP